MLFFFTFKLLVIISSFMSCLNRATPSHTPFPGTSNLKLRVTWQYKTLYMQNTFLSEGIKPAKWEYINCFQLC